MAECKSIYTVGNNSKVYLEGTLSKATFLYMKDMLLLTSDYSLVKFFQHLFIMIIKCIYCALVSRSKLETIF